MSKKKVQLIILILLMAWLGLFFMQKIDLTTADLGRHLKNGELILKGDFGLLKTNFYSYTEPNFPFLNHHWGGGVIFYLVWRIFGFAGLSFLYLAISLAIFYLFFRIAQKDSNFWLAFLVSLLLIPLMAARREIRPEIFSYLFMAVFFWILWHWRKGKLDKKWLLLLPLLEIFWINIHIYFIFGPALVGLFWVEKVIRKSRTVLRIQSLFTRTVSEGLFLCLILTGLVTFLNPFGIKGLLYPFNVFKNYGYRIVENQSVWFLENWGFNNPNLRLFEIAFGILIISFIILLIRNRAKFSFTPHLSRIGAKRQTEEKSLKGAGFIYFCLAIVFGAMGCLAIRNFTIFGFFALPIIAYNLKNIFGNFVGSATPKKGVALPTPLIIFLSLLIFLLSFFTQYQKLPLDKIRFGFGLMEGNNQAAQFVKDNNLQGLIFNNYDIGGYLIYHFYPQEKVFTDNRPEAYSISHFQEIYIPAQQDNRAWQNLNNQYDFNMIFFSPRDYTPWGQQFLISRVKDNDWAAVYFDSYAIIFLKRNKLNQSIIEQYEIPKQFFNVR